MENLFPKFAVRVYEAPIPPIPGVGDFPPLFLFPQILKAFGFNGAVNLVRLSTRLGEMHQSYMLSPEFARDFSAPQVNGLLAYLDSREPFRLGKISLLLAQLRIAECSEAPETSWPPAAPEQFTEKDAEILDFIIAQYTYAFLFFRTKQEEKYETHVLPCWKGETTPANYLTEIFVPFVWPLHVLPDEQEKYQKGVNALAAFATAFAAALGEKRAAGGDAAEKAIPAREI